MANALRIAAFLLLILPGGICKGQDSLVDYSFIEAHSASLVHLLPLLTIHGVPQSQREQDSVTILINHGYCAGFSRKYNQPVWTAYQVSKARRDVDYERYPFFTDDLRLSPSHRIGTETFGGGYDLGHLAPNAALNRQYGKLAQMESFLMSNISPQKAGLNRGIWQKLESEILNDYTQTRGKKPYLHLWVIVGPVFSEDPAFITRKNGLRIAVPDRFYCILIRPKRYPFDAPRNADYLTFLFPQAVAQSEKNGIRFITSIDEVERLTGLNFLPELSPAMQKKIEQEMATGLW